MSEPPSTRSKLGRVVRSVLRVALLVVATVTVMVVGVLALKWKEIPMAFLLPSLNPKLNS